MTYLINKGDKVRLYTYDRSDYLEGEVVAAWRGRANVWFISKHTGEPMRRADGSPAYTIGVAQSLLEKQ